MAIELPKKQAVVVGVGWAGGIIASELTKAGIEVIGLERGGERTPDDFIMQKDELRYALDHELMQDLSKETQTIRNTTDMTALPMRQLGSYLLGTDVGGAGIHWNGQAPRFFPYDFQIQTMTLEQYGEGKVDEDITIQDWGITYEEIEPYYTKWEKMAGISGEQNEVTPEMSEEYPTPPMKESPAIRLFKEASSELGLHPHQRPSANLSENYTNPDGQTIYQCQYCSFCERFGCDYQAKSDPLITVIPTALKTGNFEIKTHANVREIAHEDGVATGVYYIDGTDDQEYFQPADIVIITTYVMNNTRLLLQSGIGQPYDPETEEGVVGKHYCYQIISGADGFFSKIRSLIFMREQALSVVE